MEENFIYEFFVKPIISPETQGYNLVNTAIFIFILVLACAAIYFLLRKKIKFDSKFFLTLLPYILFGISMRVIMHQIEAGLLIIPGIIKTANPFEIGFYFFTPGIWILTFVMVCIGLLLGEVWKELKHKRTTVFGLIISIPLVLFNLYKFNNWTWFIGTMILITLVTYGVCYLINKYTKYKILSDKLNLFIVAGQGIDGIASAIAIGLFNFSEQHVVSNMVMNIHPALFSAIKILLAILICYSLDDYLKDELKKHTGNEHKINQKKNLIGFVKLIIAILGFATGLASLFKLGLI